MKVELEKTFPMPASPEVSWGFLQDVAGVAGCMPGARITERVDATHYKGTISVKVGPAGMSFKGEIEVAELDTGSRTLHLVGKGSDTSGTSGASMDLVARIVAGDTDASSNLVGHSEVSMSGKAAAFGGRMMGTVAEQILKQFAANFATEVKARAQAAIVAIPSAAAHASTAGAAAERVASTAANSVTASDLASGVATSDPANRVAAPVPANGVGAPAAGAGASPTLAPTGQFAAPPAPNSSAADFPLPSASAPARELNALTLFWAILRDWLRDLFRRKPA